MAYTQFRSLHVLASASFLSKEDRQAYLKEMQRDAQRQAAADQRKAGRREMGS